MSNFTISSSNSVNHNSTRLFNNTFNQTSNIFKNSSSKDGNSHFGNTFTTKNNTTFGIGASRPKTNKRQATLVSLCEKNPCTGSVEIEGMAAGDVFMECFGNSDKWSKIGSGGYIGFLNKTNSDILLKRTVYNYTIGYGFIQYFDMYACTSAYSIMPTSYLTCYDWVPLVPGMIRKIESNCKLANIVINKFIVNNIGTELINLTNYLKSILNSTIQLMLQNGNGTRSFVENIENYGEVTVEINATQEDNALAINLNISSANVINGTQQIFGASTLISNISPTTIKISGNFTNFSGWASNSIQTTNNELIFTYK